jgi:hypothetical protein
MHRVDRESSHVIVSGQKRKRHRTEVGQGRKKPNVSQGRDKAKGGSVISEAGWHDWILFAQHVYRENPDADICDVFDWVRIKVLGGYEYTEAVLKRADREVATDIAMEDGLRVA